MKSMRLERGCTVEAGGSLRLQPGATAVCRHAATVENDRESTEEAEPLPIWLAALLVTSFQANSVRDRHAVRWNCDSGRATYTNAGHEDERIEPLGVRLPGGQTLAVSWAPGETSYTLEVY